MSAARGKTLRATPCASSPARSTRHKGGQPSKARTKLIHSRPSQSRLPPLAQYSVGAVAQIWIGADTLVQAEPQRQGARPASRCCLSSSSRAWRHAAGARLTRTLGRTNKARSPMSQSLHSVFVVQHLREHADSSQNVKMIGVYRSRDAALAAVSRLREQPGFRELPAIVDYSSETSSCEGFHIEEYSLDKDHWTEGYVDC